MICQFTAANDYPHYPSCAKSFTVQQAHLHLLKRNKLLSSNSSTSALHFFFSMPTNTWGKIINQLCFLLGIVLSIKYCFSLYFYFYTQKTDLLFCVPLFLQLLIQKRASFLQTQYHGFQHCTGVTHNHRFTEFQGWKRHLEIIQSNLIQFNIPEKS